jgi:hypothetical protein
LPCTGCAELPAFRAGVVGGVFVVPKAFRAVVEVWFTRTVIAHCEALCTPAKVSIDDCARTAEQALTLSADSASLEDIIGACLLHTLVSYELFVLHASSYI